MLTGQEVSIMDSLSISVTGLSIVMLELGLLALFLLILSKVLSGVSSNKSKDVAAPLTPTPQVATAPASVDIADDELAAIMVAVCEESGLRPEEIVFRSINEIK